MADLDLNAECVICGKKYHCCLSCKEQKTFKPWRTIADKISCYQLFILLSDYNNEKISKEDAKEQLQRIEYDFDELKDETKAQIKYILGETKKKVSKETNKFYE